MTITASRTGALLLLMLLLSGTVGCRALERRYWRRTLIDPSQRLDGTRISGQIRNPDWGGPFVVVKGRNLVAATHAVPDPRGHVVRVPPERVQLGRELVQIIGDALEDVQARLGFTPYYHGEYTVVEMRPRPSMVHVESRRIGDDTFAVPLFAEPGQHAGEVLNDNRVLLAIWFHEFVERTLMDTGQPPTVLPDGEMHWGPFTWRSLNRTRWFRDGLANYAAVLFMRAIDRRVHQRWPELERSAEVAGVFGSISRLSRLGPTLFDQAQNDDQHESVESFCPAACGLFFLLAHDHGADAVRGYVERVKDLEFPDGEALEQLLGEVFGVPPRERVERFDFDPGLTPEGWPSWHPTLAVRPGSPAERWGFQDGDRVVQVAGDSLADFLDLELAILAASGTGDFLEVGVQRGSEVVTLRFAPSLGPVQN